MIDRSPAQPAIVTTALTKQYPSGFALDNLHLTVGTGSIFGFLGPNGAGKTTTIKLLLGFIRPSSGHAVVFGHDSWRNGVDVRRHVGYLVQSESFYPEMSGESQLEYAARLSGGAAALRGSLLEALEFSQRDLTRKFGEYSKGMKQKLALVAAIQHDPPLLILDEPTDGLDPLIQRRFLDFLTAFHARGRTIFVSSHDLAEVERLCEEIAIVREGRLIAQKSIEAIRSMRVRRVEITFAEDAPPGFAATEGVSVVRVEGRQWQVTVDGSLDPLIAALAGTSLSDLTVIPPSLDDIFLAYYDVGDSLHSRFEEAWSAGGRAAD